ncbi:MAG: CDP-diacylglycerol--serine O-phosphatidyltransferase [Planctomycetota bacterium]|nr:CDP-diacylglycerol--serine O-phosphatidyltransferase [Planctomycetota bacterium]
MKRIGILPCMVTLGNLLCGFGALAVIAHAPGSDWSRELLIAAWLIMLAMVFDMFDGKVARATNQMSDFGGELDSLCDLVSFGAAPALIIYVLCYRIFHYPVSLALLLSGCYVCATAVRLARFNVDNSHDDEAHQFFQGLASPAAAGAIASLVILNHHLVDLHRFMGSAKHASSIALEILPIVALASAGLMVSSVPYVHFTNLLVKRRRPPELAVLCAAFGLFLIFQTEFTIFCVFGGYMASGPMAYFHRRAFGADDIYEEEDEEAIV